MNMTHNMELLADNQPWNLILFMAIPVILAETVAVMIAGKADPSLFGDHGAMHGKH